MMTVCEAVKSKIEQLLGEDKMSLYSLEQKSGIPHGTLMNIMTLRNKSIDVGVLIQIADVFKMTVSEFLCDPIFNKDRIKPK